jgi:serine/threonine protein kinase
VVSQPSGSREINRALIIINSIIQPRKEQNYTDLAGFPLRLGRWVSLKITESEGTEPSQELSIYQRLCKTDAAHRIVQLLDSFVHQGPNGEHQCLVFELLGPTVDFVVADYYGGGDRLEDTTVLRVTRQLLQALAGIHRAGYAHGGLFLARLPHKPTTP